MTISEFFKTAPKGASFDITSTLSLDEPVTAYAVSLGNGGYLDFSDEGGITGVEKRQGGFEDFLRYLEETGTIGDYGYIETPTGNERIQGYRNPEKTKKLIEECFLGDEEDEEDEDYEDYEESEPEDYIRQAYNALNKHLPEVLTEKVKSYFSSWDRPNKIKDAEQKITPEMVKKINKVVKPFGDKIFSSKYKPDDDFLLLSDNAYPAVISSLSKKDFYKEYRSYNGGSDGDRLSIKNVLGVDDFSEFDAMDPKEILDKYQEVQEDWYEFWGINDLPSIRKEIIACDLDENYDEEGLTQKVLDILDGKTEKVKSDFSSPAHNNKTKDAKPKITPEMIKKINGLVKPLGYTVFSRRYNPDDPFLEMSEVIDEALFESFTKKDFYEDHTESLYYVPSPKRQIKNVLGVDNFSEFDKMDPKEILDKYQEVDEDVQDFCRINDLPTIRKEIVLANLDDEYGQKGLTKKILDILDGKDEPEPMQTFDAQCELWDVEASED